MKVRTFIFIVLIILAVIILISQFICMKYSAEISSVASALSLIVSAFAYLISERNSDKLDKALKIKRGKKGDVDDFTIDGGTF